VRMLQAEAHRLYVLAPAELRDEVTAFVRAAAELHLAP
jgi:hypothetical protein